MSIIYEPAGRAKEYSLLAANLYNGCGHGCTYCWAPSALRRGRADFHSNVAARRDVVKQIEREAAKIACTNKRVLLCFTTDPYQPLDDELQLTRQTIKILSTQCVPFQILTKGGMRAARDFDLYNKWDAFATTMTFMDAADSLEWEPGAAAPDDRIMAIQKAHDMGIATWVSLEPVIDTRQSLQIIRETRDFVDHYKIGTWNYDPRAEFINWREFGQKAIELCEKYGKTYYIKNDLARYLLGVEFNNTDTRCL